MTAALFLSDTLTAYHGGSGGWTTAPSIFTRKGGLKAAAGEILGSLSEPGEVVACLPAAATSCQVFRVRAKVGRQVTQSDLSNALEAAVSKAGGKGQAVIAAEPCRTFLDGEEVGAEPIGKPAQQLELEVAVFLSPLPFLTAIERAAVEAELEIVGVIAIEEATAASFKAQQPAPETLILVDRWHAKLMRFAGSMPAASGLSPVGSGHINSDLAVTFNLADEDAEKRALQMVLGRGQPEDSEMSEVALARLEELISRLVKAAEGTGEDLSQAMLVGLPISPPVEKLFGEHGIRVTAPGLVLDKTDPPILALAHGVERLGSGEVPRSAATALQLDAPSEGGGIIEWIRRNF